MTKLFYDGVLLLFLSLAALECSLALAPRSPPPRRMILPLARSVCPKLLLFSAAGSAQSDGAPLSPPQVLCVGEALFDCIADDSARGMTASQIESAGSWTPYPGGAVANVAMALRKLGTTSAFAGCVGSDPDGDELESMFLSAGVDTTLLMRAEGAPTRRVMVTRSKGGDRDFGGFHRGLPADVFADCLLDADSLFSPDGAGRAEAIADGAEWLVCGTLSLAFDKSAGAVHGLVDRCLASGARLCLDVNWRPVFWPEGAEGEARDAALRLARRADVVKLTDEEAEWLLGVPANAALSDPSRVKGHFPRALAVLVTAGERGAAYSAFGHEGRMEPFRVDVTETTGAGDAFTAGFLHALLSMGVDPGRFMTEVPREERAPAVEGIVRFASAAGALTCTREGAIAAQPTFEEVQSFLIHGEKVWR